MYKTMLIDSIAPEQSCVSEVSGLHVSPCVMGACSAPACPGRLDTGSAHPLWHMGLMLFYQVHERSWQV